METVSLSLHRNAWKTNSIAWVFKINLLSLQCVLVYICRDIALFTNAITVKRKTSINGRKLLIFRYKIIGLSLISASFCQIDSISSIWQNQSYTVVHGTGVCIRHRWYRKHQTYNLTAWVQLPSKFWSLVKMANLTNLSNLLSHNLGNTHIPILIFGNLPRWFSNRHWKKKSTAVLILRTFSIHSVEVS